MDATQDMSNRATDAFCALLAVALASNSLARRLEEGTKS